MIYESDAVVKSLNANMLEPVERLLALEELRTLKARYWRYVDTKQWQRFGELFAPDATFTDHSADFACAGRREIVSGISAALGAVTTVHRGHQSELDIVDATTARGIWTVEDSLFFPPGAQHPTNPMPITTVHGHGHYVERYVRLDEAWRFQTVELYRLRLETTIVSHTGYPPDAWAGDAAWKPA